MIDAVLKTERLTLRPLVPQDAPGLLRYVVENKAWLEPWEPNRAPSYFTLEGQRNILLQCDEDRHYDVGVMFGIFERQGSGDLCGRVSVSWIVRGIWQNGLVGYSLCASRAGRGYMTESLGRVVRFGFSGLGLHRLQASIIPRNRASVRVAQKCRFRLEGRALRYMKIRDVWEDHDIYAITAEELARAVSSHG